MTERAAPFSRLAVAQSPVMPAKGNSMLVQAPPASPLSSAGSSTFSRTMPRQLSTVLVMLAAFTTMIMAASFRHFVCVSPSATTIFVVQHITATRSISIKEYGLREAGLTAKSPLIRFLLTKPELSMLKEAENERSLATATGTLATDSLSFDVSQQHSNSSGTAMPPVSSELPFATKRFNAKLHMINPLQLVFDYPVAFYVSLHGHIIDIPIVTANLISLLHPVAACIAAYCFVKAVRVVENNRPAAGGAGALSTAVSPSSNSNGTAATSAGQGAMMGVPSAKFRRTASMVGASVEDAELSPLVPRSTGQNGAAVPNRCSELPVSPVAANDAAAIGAMSSLSELPHQCPSTAGRGAPTPATTPRTLTALKVCEDARKEKPMILVRPEIGETAFSEGTRYVSVKMVRLGCVFFMLRNFLDTLDGVVARLQRSHGHRTLSEHGNVPPVTTFGMNGHTVDVVTDVVGSIIILSSLLYFLIKQEVFVARVAHNLLYRWGFRWHATRSLLFGKIVAILGLAIPAFIASWWEGFMLLHVNLFDLHAPSNSAIFVLDRNPHVRFNQFLWSITCGDFTFSVFIGALLINKFWPCVQMYCFIGYAWVVLLVIYSLFVWHGIVLANPVAAALVQEYELEGKV